MLDCKVFLKRLNNDVFSLPFFSLFDPRINRCDYIVLGLLYLCGVILDPLLNIIF